MKLYPIVLAAGFSSRFGSNKLLHPVEGLPMYRHIVDVLLDICSEDGGIAAPVVVTQYGRLSQSWRESPCLLCGTLTAVRGFHPLSRPVCGKS